MRKARKQILWEIVHDYLPPSPNDQLLSSNSRLETDNELEDVTIYYPASLLENTPRLRSYSDKSTVNVPKNGQISAKVPKLIPSSSHYLKKVNSESEKESKSDKESTKDEKKLKRHLSLKKKLINVKKREKDEGKK